MKHEKAIDWLQEIDLAQTYKEVVCGSPRWARYRAYLRNEFPVPPGHPDKPQLPYNITYSILHTMLPNVCFKNPYVSVQPRAFGGFPRYRGIDADIHAKLIEGIDNWLIKEMDLLSQVRALVRQAFCCGTGVMKVGYGSEFRLPEAADEIADAVIQAAEGKARELNDSISSTMPWVMSIDPDSFLVPYGTLSLGEARWVDHVVTRRLSDVLAKDSGYKNTSGLGATRIADSKYLVNKRGVWQEFQDRETALEFVELHEVRDKYTGEIFVAAFSTPASENEQLGSVTILRGPDEDQLQIEGLPFVTLQFNQEDDRFWCTPDACIMEPQQLEMNAARTQAMEHRQSALLRLLVERGVLKAEEIDKMARGDVGAIIQAETLAVGKVLPVQPHIPPDQIAWPGVIRDDTREVLGFGRMASGEMPSGRHTATQSLIVNQGKELRVDERRSLVGEVIEKVMRKVNQVIFKFWQAERVAKVVGFDGAVYWVSYTPDAIKGEYALAVDVESLAPSSKETKRRDIIQLMQILGNNPRLNVDYLMRLIAREFEWVDVERLLPTSPENVMAAGPIGQQEFTNIQRRILTNPAEAQARSKRNAGVMEQGGVE